MCKILTVKGVDVDVGTREDKELAVGYLSSLSYAGGLSSDELCVVLTAAILYCRTDLMSRVLSMR